MTIGAIKDREYSKFVESPSRGDPNAAVEVLVGNTEPIPVVVSGNYKCEYNEVNGVGLDTLTIINFTLGLGVTAQLLSIEGSGENYGVYTVQINNATKYKKRSYYTDYNINIDLGMLEIVAGDNVKVIVENKVNSGASFNATLNYNEITL